MVKIDKNCIECGEKKTRKDRARPIYLCDLCSTTDKYKLLYKTDIKNQYLMTEDELEDYECYIVKGRRGYPDMTMYKISDVKDIFCMNYTIDRNDNVAIENKINELQADKQKKSLDRKEKINKRKMEISEKRKTKLVKVLKSYDLKLRDDSKLCNGYIDGTITDWGVDQIVQRMCQMKYLYDYCHMNDCYDEAYEDQQEELEAGYFPDCTVIEQAELVALDKYSGNAYPNVWPWMI
jgi:hypothetical protein